MTVTWYLQGSTDTEISSTDTLQFANGSFDGNITVDEYNDSTHVKNDGGTEDSSGNTPNNVKFISQAGGTGGDSQADWGGGTEDLDAIEDGECTLKINLSHGSSVSITNAEIYAYDGATPATAPTDVDVRLAESGDANFTEAEGSGSACSLGDKTASTSHDFYIVATMSPTAVGAKTGTLRFAFTYS